MYWKNWSVYNINPSPVSERTKMLDKKLSETHDEHVRMRLLEEKLLSPVGGFFYSPRSFMSIWN